MEVAVKMAAMVVGRTAPLWRLNVGRLAIRKPRDAGVYPERRLPRRRRQHRLRHQPPSRRLVHVAIRDADHMFHASKPPATTYARRKSRSSHSMRTVRATMASPPRPSWRTNHDAEVAEAFRDPPFREHRRARERRAAECRQASPGVLESAIVLRCWSGCIQRYHRWD